ncbi:MAG: hypothetical protein A2277_13145 [Desulfobacterales bacterium RIFOXYA12_FULL_46_15]|nr:MAG: hypothetical protein A2277_13145 [Desulfobacterales bacterium RIFOXYA12_FULL_46_15]
MDTIFKDNFKPNANICEYLLAFSCKHRQWVFSIPKRLRIYFLYDRKLIVTDGCFLDDGRRIYEVGPLLFPKCQSSMRIISFTVELDIIEKILRHLDLWYTRNHDPPQKVSDYILELVYN